MKDASRENKLQYLAIKYKHVVGGPAHQCMEAILAAGVPRTINETPVSYVTGAVSCVSILAWRRLTMGLPPTLRAGQHCSHEPLPARSRVASAHATSSRGRCAWAAHPF